MIRAPLILVMLLSICSAMHGQGDWWFDSEEREREITNVDKRPFSERSFKERLTLGGGAALQFGNITLIGASPQIGYRVNKNLLAGVGTTYYLQRFKESFGNYDQNFYGGNLFARRRLITRFFAHAEWEHVSMQSGIFTEPPTRMWSSFLWLGGGYYQGLTDRLGAGLVILYDVTENPVSPYDNPTIRGGVSFGF